MRLVPAITILLLLAPAVAPPTAAQATPHDAEWTDSHFDLRLAADVSTATLGGHIDIHTITPDDPEIQPAVARFCGSSCAADELRDIHDFLQGEDRRAFVEALETAARDRVHARLGAIDAVTVRNLTATVDATTLQAGSDGPEHHPAVRIDVAGDLAIDIGANATANEVDAMLRMGANLAFSVPLSAEPGQNVTITISTVDPRLGVANGEPPTRAGQGAQTRITNWAGATPVENTETLVVGRPEVQTPTAERIDVRVTLDLSALDINLFQGISGVTVDAQLAVDVDLHSVTTEDQVTLPPQIQIEHLSADAIRIARATFPGTVDQFTALESDLRQQLVELVQDTGGTADDVTGGFDATTMTLDNVGEPPGTGPPIQLHFDATTHLGTPAGTALTVTTFPLPLDNAFPRIQGHNTTYTIILPAGISIDQPTVNGGRIIRSGTNEGGQGILEFTVTDDEADVQAQAAVTEQFVIREFWWLLLIVLVIVLLPILLVVAMMMRRKRRGVEPPETKRMGGS